MKQQRLNQFLSDLSVFIEKYYSEGVNEIRNESVEDWVKIKIYGDEDSVLELWSDHQEITVVFGEYHCHIDDYHDPCDMNAIYRQTIHWVLKILDGELGTYSCWIGKHCKGGASFNALQDQAVEEAKESFRDFDRMKIKVWGMPLQEIKII